MLTAKRPDGLRLFTQIQASFTKPAIGFYREIMSQAEPGETETLAIVRRLLINETLAMTNGNQKAAARLLGVPSSRMDDWTKALGLRPKDRDR